MSETSTPIYPFKVEKIRPGFLKKHCDFVLNRDTMTFGDKTFLCRNIAGITYGSLLTRVHGVSTLLSYEAKFRNQDGQTMRVSLTSSPKGEGAQKNEEIFNQFYQALWEPIVGRMMKEWYEKLRQKKNITVGSCEVTPHGLNLSVRSWFGKNRHFVPWQDCLRQHENGFLVLFSKQNKKIRVRLPFMRLWDVIILDELITYLWAEGRAFALSKSVPGVL